MSCPDVEKGFEAEFMHHFIINNIREVITYEFGISGKEMIVDVSTNYDEGRDNKISCN